MILGIGFQKNRLWRPVVAQEHSPSEKFQKPRPVGIAVIIGRSKEYGYFFIVAILFE